jgi:PhnB protein
MALGQMPSCDRIATSADQRDTIMTTLTETRPTLPAKNAGLASGVTAHLTTPGADNAITFYEKAFEAREAYRALDDSGKKVMHAHLKINGGSIYLNDDFPEYMGGKPTPPPAGICLHLQVDDADAWFARALNAGAAVEMPLQDMFWGERYGRLRDPWGYVWSISSALPTED